MSVIGKTIWMRFKNTWKQTRNKKFTSSGDYQAISIQSGAVAL